MNVWHQIYDPFGNPLLSTAIAAIPVVILLGLIALGHVKTHVAAMIALAAAFLVAVFGFSMPAMMAVKASWYGFMIGLFPIGWIIINVIFLYRLTVENGSFQTLQNSLADIVPDRRLQLLLIAFCFGAFFEGAAGFGTPVAVTGAILIGLGFSPLAASGLALIANTAPVAFGALGTPIITLASVMQLTGNNDLDAFHLGAMVGRQLPFFSLLVPFWLIWAFAGFRGMIQIWPAILVCGGSFALMQFAISNYHGPWLVDVAGSLVSMLCLIGFLKIWQPRQIWTSAKLRNRPDDIPADAVPAGSLSAAATPESLRTTADRKAVLSSWVPWIILCVFVFIWGTQTFKSIVNPIFSPKWAIDGLHMLVQKMPPVVPTPVLEGAVFNFNILTMTGTGIFVAAIVAGLVMKYSPVRLVRAYGETFWVLRAPLLTVAAMLALGTLTKYSGVDATLGLAFASTGVLYPFFGTLLGWLGVALTGSDTASNVLFGGLQKTAAQQLGLSPILMGAANSSGGVMGKMIDAQSIVVAATATNYVGNEGKILRYVFWHSIVLACLVGGLIMLQAYVWPFTSLVIH
ncbi:L-lactate permease [[Pseudomonas] carboxydohydrogena]|uniref:L-lactate permease n=1 Tax=Afipia carboxydohydrogena TaxID=290 RepID=A0ABY8BQF7_AFICR|nr:L-lactate permease [[Pseudomonas] carboxydohydrogena]WEF52188.1 L-lactate permease [[Pseudomonas] carboxydohydrogena]